MFQRRRILRIGVIASVFSLACLALIDHAGLFGFAGNDWSAFHQQTFRVREVLSADQFTIDSLTTVQLLGVASAEKDWAIDGKYYLKGRVEGKCVTLRLEPTQTRDSAGHLLAFVYFTDTDLINLDIVHDGQAFADRRVAHSLHQQIEQAENEARKKQRGMWKLMSDDDQPTWRLEWLRSFKKRNGAD